MVTCTPEGVPEPLILVKTHRNVQESATSKNASEESLDSPPLAPLSGTSPPPISVYNISARMVRLISYH